MYPNKRSRDTSLATTGDSSLVEDVEWPYHPDMTRKRRLQNLAAQQQWRTTARPHPGLIDAERERQRAESNNAASTGRSASITQTPGNALSRHSAYTLVGSPGLDFIDAAITKHHNGSYSKLQHCPQWEQNLQSDHLPASVTTSYVRQPLQHPDSQVRLLYLKVGNLDDPVSATISTYKLDNAPPFRAVSYTWGNPTILRNILIEGQPFEVRQHCHYALAQVRYHYPDSHVWVDSVCIDQENMDEKSQQVGLMGEIYARASAVMACIGPHDEGSLCVEDALPYVDIGRDIPVQRTPWTDNDRSRWCSWVQDRNFTYLTRLCSGFEKLMHRGYWSRLWIVQELVGGGNNIQILCGESILDWWRLRELGAMLYYHKELRKRPYIDHNLDPLPTLELWELAMAYERFPLELVLYRTKTLQCEKILDRIYGTMRLVEWPTDSAPLVPDYSKTAAQLAVDVLERIIPSTPYLSIVGDLLHNLGLDSDTFLGELPTTAFWHSTRPWHMNILYACRIEAIHENGEFFAQGRLPGLACKGSQPGDIFVSSTIQDLLLRIGSEGDLRVIGAAAAATAAAPDLQSEGKIVCECTPGLHVHMWYSVHLQTDLDIEDAVAFADKGVRQLGDGLSGMKVPRIGSRIRAVTRDGARELSLAHLLDCHIK